ncbi:MAG TPA: ABC transporter permease [Candidatus Aphodousia gallistercoris]|nr:ABC transporter permease [Candidatus Aphodousia gallistercoris]
MLEFFIRRLLQAALVLLTVAFIAFLLFQFVGDPVSQMLGIESTQEDRERLREALGLNDPFYVQFLHFIANAVQGDFGLSLRQGSPVSELIADRFPATFELAMVSVLIATVLGVAMGVFVAIYKESFIARFLMGFSLVGISLPTFLIGILFILVFSVWLGWLPSYGRGEVVQIGWWSTGLLTADGLKHLLLPAATLSIFQIALIMRLVRAEMLEVLRSDFIKFARARGLSERSIHFRHALKNTLIPVITIVGLQLGGIIAFSIVTETVFQWPGLGLLFIQAVQFADIPVMTAYLCLIALMFVLINFIVDWLYTVVDPRLKPGLSRKH